MQLYSNSINNFPCPRVYTPWKECLLPRQTSSSILSPRNGGEEKEKFIGAPFPFSPSFIGRSPPPPPPPPVFPFCSPDFRGRFSSSLVAWPGFHNLPLRVLGAACIASLKYPRFWRGLILPEREWRGGERGIEIGTGLEIILILVRARNIRNSGNQK